MADDTPTHVLPAPSRNEGTGPYERLILRGVTVIDGTGGPPYGPADILIARNRIDSIVAYGANTAGRHQPSTRPSNGESGTHEIDLTGKYAMPGIIDVHTHIGSQEKVPCAEYVYKLWLAHGITTVREIGSFWNGYKFVLSETARSEANEITAPRIIPYIFFGQGREEPFITESEARAWIGDKKAEGLAGIKFGGYRPDIFRAALDECRVLGVGSACHHAQQEVARAHALTTARWGLQSIEHWYGLPEALFTDRTIQEFPASYNYFRERDRFSVAGELWAQAASRGSRKWVDTLDELVELGVTLDPTFVIYSPLRDLARARSAEWLETYAAPRIWDYWRPDPMRHGSAHTGWTTELEVTWKHNMRRWMDFVADFKNRGGRVTVGSDAGSNYQLYGFATIEEMELLREAGFTPLEIVRSATLWGAEVLGLDRDLGSLEPGKVADVVVTDGNPLADLKTLYGRTPRKYIDTDATPAESGVALVIKDGLVYDAPSLLDDVKTIVAHGASTN